MPAAGGPQPLPRSFFGRATGAVARDLVGVRLLCDPGTPQEVEAILVEVEAYLGLEDPASHAYRGPRGRAAIMFGPPGHLYVYLSYGMHHCANVVCEPEGVAGAVLLRAALVERGEQTVVARRARLAGARPAEKLGEAAQPGAPGRQLRESLLSGPGNLGAGLGLSLADNGADLCDPGSRLRLLPALTSPPVGAGPRVGISQAAERPLRFFWTGHPAVSRPRGLEADPR